MAAKLKDGLFLGDFETAQDMEFIIANKARDRGRGVAGGGGCWRPVVVCTPQTVGALAE